MTFCGGEPLLVRKVDQYAASLSTYGKYTVLNTNGSLLRKRLAKASKWLLNGRHLRRWVDTNDSPCHARTKADLDEALSAAEAISRDSTFV